MINLIINNIKIYFRNKDVWIWNFIFPFAYMLIFVMAMRNLNNPETMSFEPIKLALIPAQEESAPSDNEIPLEKFFQYMKDEVAEADISENSLVLKNPEKDTEELVIKYIKVQDSEEANDLLSKELVDASISDEKEPHIQFQGDSVLKPIILSEIVKAYQQQQENVSAIKNLSESGELNLLDILKTQKDLSSATRYTLDLDQQEGSLSSILILFFSLLAYLAFYPLNSGIYSILRLESNRTNEALRDTVSPQPKWKRAIANLLPTIVIHLLSITLLYFILTRLNVGFDKHHPQMLVVIYLSTLCGIFLGTAIASLTNFSESLLISFSIMIPLFLAMCSGMMGEQLYISVKQNAPWLLEISPIGIASKAFYVLHAGADPSLYSGCIQSLAIFAGICLILTIIGLRRNSYESL